MSIENVKILILNFVLVSHVVKLVTQVFQVCSANRTQQRAVCLSLLVHYGFSQQRDKPI